MSKVNLRSIMLHEFKLGTSASEFIRKMKLAFGDSVIQKTAVFKYFQRFKACDFNLEDESRSGRPNSRSTQIAYFMFTVN